MDKKDYITRLAVFLMENNMSMDVPTLANHLNWNGFTTNSGDSFKGKRGSYTLISSTYEWLASMNRYDEAGKVALAFRKPDGTYAYEHEKQ